MIVHVHLHLTLPLKYAYEVQKNMRLHENMNARNAQVHSNGVFSTNDRSAGFDFWAIGPLSFLMYRKIIIL